MAILAQNEKLNIVPGGIIPVVHASQYDVDRVLTFTLYDGLSAASLPTGVTGLIEGTKPDDKGFQYAVTSINGNVVTVKTTKQMTAVKGTVKCKIVLTKDNMVLGTALFFLEVDEAGLDDETDISETDLPFIRDMAETNMLNAEAWAVGTKNGEPVGSVEPQYNNYSKYYADRAHEDAVISGSAMLIAGQSAESARESAVISGSAMRIAGQSAATAQSAAADALGYKSQASESAAQAAASAIQSAASAATSADAEAWADGKRGGVDVPSTDPAYHNNAKWWAEQAEDAVSYGIVDMVGATATTNGKHGAAHEPVAGQENYYWRGDATWSREDMTVTEITDSAPYLYRASKGGDRQYDELVGGSVVFNQLVNTSDTTCTVPNGHKYIFKHNTTYTVAISDGNAFSVDGSANDNVHDITKMFGSTIADYIYAREIAETGSGIAWIKSYGFFSKDYYAYDTGSILSVNTSGHKLEGKNLLALPYYDGASKVHNGVKFTVNEDGSVLVNRVSASSSDAVFYLRYFQNINGTVESNPYVNKTITINGVPSGSTASNYRIRFIHSDANNSTNVYSAGAMCTVEDISGQALVQSLYIEIKSSYSPSNLLFKPMIRDAEVADGTFKSYVAPITYPLTSTDLRGILSLSGDELVYDGDVYKSDGTETVKYGIVDLGTLTWELKVSAANINYFAAPLSSLKYTSPRILTLICPKYTCIDDGRAVGEVPDKSIYNISLDNNLNVAVIDNDYSDVATFTTAMNGVYLVYPLNTPTTATLSPFVSPQICDKDGTEEYIDTRAVPMPVGHHTEYYGVPEWLRDRYLDELRELPYKITPISNGGTGLSSSPSMLTNLGSTTAANVLQASPRPGVTGTLKIANGGTGLTTSPSMLTNLGSTSADNVLKASPRPGVTGTLPVGNGGTGVTSLSALQAALKVPIDLMSFYGVSVPSSTTAVQFWTNIIPVVNRMIYVISRTHANDMYPSSLKYYANIDSDTSDDMVHLSRVKITSLTNVTPSAQFPFNLSVGNCYIYTYSSYTYYHLVFRGTSSYIGTLYATVESGKIKYISYGWKSSSSSLVGMEIILGLLMYAP